MMKTYLKDHPLQAVIWVSVNCKVVFSFPLYNVMIPQNVMHLYTVNSLSPLWEDGKVTP